MWKKKTLVAKVRVVKSPMLGVMLNAKLLQCSILKPAILKLQMKRENATVLVQSNVVTEMSLNV
jgi:hypothetical protein